MAPTVRTEATVRTGSGSPARATRWSDSLILVVTRRCDLRCAYCPTVKDGEPDLSPSDALRAVDLFVSRHGGGDCKLFGGEPLLVPEAVEAVIRHAPPSVNVYLSTNGSHLSRHWIDILHAFPGVTLTVSLDGAAADHDGLRRGARTYDTAIRWLPELLRLPRFVVTQTIAPSTAARAAENFRHLRSLGLRKFNLLPGYFLPWTEAQLAALRASFDAIAEDFESAWAGGERLYLRNLFVRAPTPFYNTGFVVDSDGRIYPNNLVLAGAFDSLRAHTSIGTLDAPPSPDRLAEATAAAPAVLEAAVGARVMECTRRADAELTRLCNRLYPAYFDMRARA
ncbi:MAG: radical SAM protein [Deltaproteobacteria bacterium]|nr:radical SAM protein [Deltaproteobacteria bacterium]